MPTRQFLNPNGTSESATYSGADGFRYFGWGDVEHHDAEKLAGVFVSRFPGICAASEGRDWEYTGWLSELSGHVSRTRQLPFVAAEYFEPGPEELTYIPLRDYEKGGEVGRFPLPPPVASGERELIKERDDLRIRVEQLSTKVRKAIQLLK